MEARLPARLEANALMRAVSAAGGFATVLATGDQDAGTLLVVCCQNGRNAEAFERMPSAQGRSWTRVRAEDTDAPGAFSEYLQRRRQQDPDIWIIELDIAEATRFIGMTSHSG